MMMMEKKMKWEDSIFKYFCIVLQNYRVSPYNFACKTFVLEIIYFSAFVSKVSEGKRTSLDRSFFYAKSFYSAAIFEKPLRRLF